MTSSKQPRPAVTRRKLLAAGAGVAALGATGAIWMGSRYAGPYAWIEAVLRSNLPGMQLEPQSLAKFVREIAARPDINNRTARLAMTLDQTAPAITRRMSVAQRRVARLERRVLTEYLVGSNFFRVSDPQSEAIVYAGALPACGNPFAKFRDA
jgi:hypothetical protein